MMQRREALRGSLRAPTPPRPKSRTLKPNVADFKPNQTERYYLVGESADRLKSNPHSKRRAPAASRYCSQRPGRCLWTMMPSDFEGKPSSRST